MSDGNASYDWFVYDWYIEIVPGYVLAGYDSNYGYYTIKNFYERTYANYYTNQILYRYGPDVKIETSDSTASVNVGTTAGYKGASVTAGFSYSWNIHDIEVFNWSDLSVQKENHKWAFNPSDSGKETNIVHPAVNTRVGQGNNGKAKFYRSIHWWDGHSEIYGYNSDTWFTADNYNS